MDDLFEAWICIKAMTVRATFAKPFPSRMSAEVQSFSLGTPASWQDFIKLSTFLLHFAGANLLDPAGR